MGKTHLSFHRLSKRGRLSLVTREQGIATKLERNAGLVSVVVLSALLVPQIITRAMPANAGLVEIYVATGIGLLIFLVTYFVVQHMARTVPRRTSSQVASTYLGEGAGVLVVSAHFVAYGLLAVLGAGLMTDVLDFLVPLGVYRSLVLVEFILFLSLPVLLGKSVSWRFIVGCALVGAAAIAAVLIWALVSEALGGIDLATSRLEPWTALETARLSSLRTDSFLEAILGAMFPAAVLSLMHERVLVAPELRRVSIHVLRRIFEPLIIVILITLYFVGILQMPSYHLSVVTLSMAYGFWGLPGQIIVGVCYMLAGMAGVLTAYAHLPRLLRALAMERFLPRRMADAGASASRLAIVIAVALLASVLATVLTTTQAGAMVFIFLAFVILGIVCAAMALRMSVLAREEVVKAERQRMRFAAWMYRIAVIFDIAVLMCIAYVNWAWALAGILSLAVPASVLIFFRRERLKVRRFLEVDNLAEGHTLPTRVHGVIYIAGTLDASVVKAVSYARGMRLSSLTAITVDYDPKTTRVLREDWKNSAMPVSLTVLGSPRKASHSNVVDYVRNLRSLHPQDTVVVFVPRVITTGLIRPLLVRHSTAKMLSDLRMEDGVVLAEVPYVLTEGN